MNKTNLGIQENLYAALVFLVALAGLFPVILFAVVAFVMKESDYIKKTAMQSVGFMFVITILSIILRILFGAANIIILPFLSFLSSPVVNLYNMLKNIVLLVQYIGIFVFSYRAYQGKTIKIPFVDDFADKCL